MGYAQRGLGYFSGYSSYGWVTSLGNPVAMAEKIAGLTSGMIEQKSQAFPQFTSLHTFEGTFKDRARPIGSVADRDSKRNISLNDTRASSISLRKDG